MKKQLSARNMRGELVRQPQDKKIANKRTFFNGIWRLLDENSLRRKEA